MAFGQYQNYYNPYVPQQPFYTQQMPSPMAPPPSSAQPANQPPQGAVGAGNGLVWVGSRQEAQIYPVAPGCVVPLWDANGPYVYIRQADNAGKPSFSAFKLVQADEEIGGEYATKQELEALKEEIRSMVKGGKKSE